MTPPTRAPSAWRSANAEPTCPPAVVRRLDAPYTAVRPNTTSTAASSASRRVSQRRAGLPAHLLNEVSLSRTPPPLGSLKFRGPAHGTEQRPAPPATGPASAGASALATL